MAHQDTSRWAAPALPKPGSLGKAQTIRRVVLSAPLISPGRSLFTITEALRNEDIICQRQIAVHSGRPQQTVLPARNLTPPNRTGGRSSSRLPLRSLRLCGWLFRSSSTSVRWLESDAVCTKWETRLILLKETIWVWCMIILLGWGLWLVKY